MIITPPPVDKTQISPQEPVIVQRMGLIDEPPPYAARQLTTSASFQDLIPTVSSQSQRAMTRTTSTPRLGPLLPPPSAKLTKREILATNFLFLHTRNEPIRETFHIDPDLPVVELNKAGKLALDRLQYNQKHKQKHRHHTKKNIRAKNQVPNAIFQSKNGEISLGLAIVAPPLAGKSTALVQASSRKGNIDIKIPFINTLRRLNLEVSTRHGNILILIPRSFSGYIQAYSKNGKLVFLPHLTATMNLVARRDREMQVVVGDSAYQSSGPGLDWTGDTIHVASRHGHIYIGFVNEDRKPIEETGFWKKVFDGMLDALVK